MKASMNKSRRYPLRIDRVTFTLNKSGPHQVVLPKTAEIDEVVIGDSIHLEVLDRRVIWIRLGDRAFTVYVPIDPRKPIDVKDQMT